jgi:hypothetical protein
LPIAVAGGINSESAGRAVATGAGIVVVGGAITKAEDAAAATRAMRAAMDARTSVASEHFRRVGGRRRASRDLPKGFYAESLRRHASRRGDSRVLPIAPGMKTGRPRRHGPYVSGGLGEARSRHRTRE